MYSKYKPVMTGIIRDPSLTRAPHICHRFWLLMVGATHDWRRLNKTLFVCQSVCIFTPAVDALTSCFPGSTRHQCQSRSFDYCRAFCLHMNKVYSREVEVINRWYLDQRALVGWSVSCSVGFLNMRTKCIKSRQAFILSSVIYSPMLSHWRRDAPLHIKRNSAATELDE